MHRLRVFAGLLLAGALAAPAAAIPIAPAAFGAAALVESFEAIPLGANIRIGMGTSLLEPGTTSAWTFASGVVLTSPVPNPGVLSRGAFVHDLARATDVTNNWGATGVINDPTDVPFGDAYLGAFHPSTGTASIELSFATPVDRVGAYVSGVAGSTITLRVYDAGGALLETVSAGAVPLASWSGNFLGVQQPGRIARIVFTAPDFGLDALTFEDSPLLVPEASTIHALALGLVGLWGLATLGRRPAAARY
ncbi:MAG: hypothetical protein DCC71_03055 [Proteobacteria bacterium]|nr:MAG: hypothetical protein DCC71_03055 [Pseudomonadota bacterium]